MLALFQPTALSLYFLSAELGIVQKAAELLVTRCYDLQWRPQLRRPA
jgi:hypothetical protein